VGISITNSPCCGGSTSSEGLSAILAQAMAVGEGGWWTSWRAGSDREGGPGLRLVVGVDVELAKAGRLAVAKQIVDEEMSLLRVPMR
jgi:hypothetical protein